ncbi:MAG TPA: addiction module protein [Longimicrobium sp.]|nr:addiction module protein [Longimicrobium sp.]
MREEARRIRPAGLFLHQSFGRWRIACGVWNERTDRDYIEYGTSTGSLKMSAHVDQIEQIESDLLSLPREARARLAQALAASLEDDPEEGGELDPETADYWEEEAERRYQQYLSGEKKALPADQAIAEIRARLRK